MKLASFSLDAAPRIAVVRIEIEGLGHSENRIIEESGDTIRI